MRQLNLQPRHECQKPISVDGMIYCPVCGFGPWDDPISPHNICPCCFTEYGFDDTSDRQLKWIREMWFEDKSYMPLNWDPNKQLKNAIDGWDMWKNLYE